MKGDPGWGGRQTETWDSEQLGVTAGGTEGTGVWDRQDRREGWGQVMGLLGGSGGLVKVKVVNRRGRR